jgi:imidazole glycerol phosphate synthase subunit HisF
LIGAVEVAERGAGEILFTSMDMTEQNGFANEALNYREYS